MKLPKAAFAVVVGLLMLFASPAIASDWKMKPLNDQVSIIQEAQELQKTNRQEFLCLALAIFHETHGQPLSGMAAVGHVIKNRTQNGKFDSTICGVVWQRNQFTWTSWPVGAIIPKDRKSWVIAQQVALTVLDATSDPTRGATYFYNRKTDNPRWAHRGRQTLISGPHIFVAF